MYICSLAGFENALVKKSSSLGRLFLIFFIFICNFNLMFCWTYFDYPISFERLVIGIFTNLFGLHGAVFIQRRPQRSSTRIPFLSDYSPENLDSGESLLLLSSIFPLDFPVPRFPNFLDFTQKISKVLRKKSQFPRE